VLVGRALEGSSQRCWKRLCSELPIDSFLLNDRVLPHFGKRDVCIPAKGKCLGFFFFWLADDLMNSSIQTSIFSKASLYAAALSVFKQLYILAQTDVAGTSIRDGAPLVPGSQWEQSPPSLEQREGDPGLPHLTSQAMKRAELASPEAELHGAWASIPIQGKSNQTALWWELAPLRGNWSSPRHEEESNTVLWRNGRPLLLPELMVQSVSAAGFYPRGRGSAEV